MAYNNYGGGGFISNSQASPGSDSPGESRFAAVQALTPVTLKQCLDATQAHSDAPHRIDGKDINEITTVAQVLSKSRTATNLVYYLDDGTGRMEARFFFVQDAGMDGGQDEEDKWIQENSFIRVTGKLKQFSNKRYINASLVRPAGFSPSAPPLPPTSGQTNANGPAVHELYFHFLEVMQMTVVRKKGPHPKFVGQTGSGSGPAAAAPTHAGAAGVANPYSNSHSPASAVSGKSYAGLPLIQRLIMQFMASQPDSMDGVNIGAIVRGVQNGTSDPNAINDALETLMENGELFNTIDDSHFKMT